MTGENVTHLNPVEALCDRVFSDYAHDQGRARQRAMLVAGLDPLFAQVWDEAAEATADWMSNNPGPSGVPSDPPRNPYDERGD